MIAPKSTPRTSYVLSLPLKPRAKQRPQHAQGQTYTPAPTVNAEALIKVFALHMGVRPLTGPVVLDIKVFLARPLGHTRAQRQSPWATTRPDWDNYGKLVSDALNAIGYADDAHVVDARVRKLYAAEGTQPRWEIRLEAAEAA